VLALLRASVRALPAEPVAVREAVCRVLTEPVVSTVDVPDFARSAVDGFAVRASDLADARPEAPVELVTRAALTRAGSTGPASLGPGEAHPVATGAPVPAAADAVVMIEDVTRPAESAVRFTRPTVSGKHVIAVGEDVARGDQVLPAGRRLRPQDAALLASIGRDRIEVHRRPVCRVLVTGDEIVTSLSARTSAAQIVDTNSITVAALATRDGATLELASGPLYARDDPGALHEALTRPSADVVLVIGGSSVGVEDHAPRVVAEAGELLVHGIAVRPGGPAGVGRVGETWVFLLPGHPVACLVAYELVAGPVLRALGGRPMAWPHRTAEVTLGSAIDSAAGRLDYVRVTVDAGVAHPIRVGASNLSSTVRADGAVLVPEERDRLEAGERVHVLYYDG
jgi:molybdopterin molybdotransferase